MDPYPRHVIVGAHPPWPCAVTAHDRARDGQPRPVEVTVIAQFTAAADDNIRELVKRCRRPSFGTQQRRRARTQLRGGVAEHGRILADVDDRVADRQRKRHELVQSDVERNAVPRRACEPLGQPCTLG